jgi:hypothetical protein
MCIDCRRGCITTYVASVPPFAGYNSPDPQWLYDAAGNPLGQSGPGTGPVHMPRVPAQSATQFIRAGGRPVTHADLRTFPCRSLGRPHAIRQKKKAFRRRPFKSTT